MVYQHATRGLMSAVGVGERQPKKLRPNQVRCPVCRVGATVRITGELRSHDDLFGYHCYNTDPPKEN